MGLFDKTKKWISAGGNFNIIAQTFATQYTILRVSNYGASLPLEERLYAVAIINMADSLRSNQISITEVGSSVLRSTQCYIKLPDYEFCWCEESDDSELTRLFNLLLQVEALLFSAYTKVSHKTVVEQIVSQMKGIYKVFKEALDKKEKSPVFSTAYPSVANAVSNYFFRYIVSCFSLQLAMAHHLAEQDKIISQQKNDSCDQELDEALHETGIPHPDFYGDSIESLDELHSYAWKHIDIEESALKNSESWLREIDEINEQMRDAPVPDPDKDGKPIRGIADLLSYARRYKLACAPIAPRSRSELNTWIADCRIPNPNIPHHYIETIDDYLSFAKDYNRQLDEK